MKKYKYKKPRWFGYNFLFKVGCKFYSKYKINLKVTRNEVKRNKGPYVVIANHESIADFFTVVATLPRLHLVIGSSFYHTSPIKGCMDRVRVIPKQQFQTLPTDLKRMKEVLDHNMPLLLYPAGLMTEHGASTPIPLSTAKFLKWLKSDVYVANIKGTFLSKPKWTKQRRKGQCLLDIYKLYSKEELQNISNHDLHNKINEVLSFDAYDNQEELLIKYDGVENMEGFENVLYKCPKCGEEFTIIAQNNKLICTHCQNTMVGDCYGFLGKEKEDDIVYRHPSKWALNIKEELKNEIQNNDLFFMEDNCQIQLLNLKARKYETAGYGRVRLDKETITLEGMLNDEEFKLEVPSTCYTSLPVGLGKCFEIQAKDRTYRLLLENGKQAIKWVWAVEALFKLNNL